jgi:hypothetical protein
MNGVPLSIRECSAAAGGKRQLPSASFTLSLVTLVMACRDEDGICWLEEASGSRGSDCLSQGSYCLSMLLPRQLIDCSRGVDIEQ